MSHRGKMIEMGSGDGAAHPEVEVHVYPGADHGFQSDRPTHYHAEAARLAQQRTRALFGAA